MTTFDCITPAFLADNDCASMFPLDAAHFRGDHDEQPHPACVKCQRAHPVQEALDVEESR